MGAGAVAVIVAKEKHIVEAFRRVGSTRPDAAIAPATVGVGERIAFHRLRDHAVLREASTGLFYLDEPSWGALRRMRRRLALAWVLVILFAAVVVWLKR